MSATNLSNFFRPKYGLLIFHVIKKIAIERGRLCIVGCDITLCGGHILFSIQMTS